MASAELISGALFKLPLRAIVFGYESGIVIGDNRMLLSGIIISDNRMLLTRNGTPTAARFAASPILCVAHALAIPSPPNSLPARPAASLLRVPAGGLRGYDLAFARADVCRELRAWLLCCGGGQ